MRPTQEPQKVCILTYDNMVILKAAAFRAAVWQLQPGPMKACTPELI